MEVSVRAYSASDYDAVMELLRLNTPAFFSPEEESDFDDYLTHEIEYYYVIQCGELLIACGGINRDEDGITARISWDIVHPDYQGKGVGSQLLRHRIAVVRTFPGVQLLVVRTSQFAWEFYAKYGFRLRETVRNYWAPGYDLFTMEMPL
jgi:[ribosomal protein S18]-alanine N-acetyltransferase